jgi:Restriction endonuclease
MAVMATDRTLKIDSGGGQLAARSGLWPAGRADEGRFDLGAHLDAEPGEGEMVLSTKEPDRFEQFVADLLRRMGREGVEANVVFHGSLDHDYEIDILFGTKGDATIVEVKAYRYRSPPAPDLFAKALSRVVLVQQETNAEHSMLVMSCPLTPALASLGPRFPNVEIWDGPQIFEAASRYPDLLGRLEGLLEVAISDVLGEVRGAEVELGLGTSISRGQDLADALKAIPPGRADAYLFEQKCIEALKYLFERDLFGWHEQHETEDGLNRRDLVCRILPNAEVWRLMLTDLKSRYVVFEFKNYSEPITQSEIVTTERYLYPSALRRLAIIISPHGCSRSATRVIQGAMRENGKLLISLNIDDLASLLVDKDAGSDPNTFLFDRVDNFLMSLGR